MRPRCPSDLALERYLLRPTDRTLREHLEACADCGERLARMDEQGQRFLAEVYPATREQVLALADAAPP